MTARSRSVPAGANMIQPMLASVGSAIPSGRDWVFEPKYDGIRIIGYALPDSAALVTRNALDKTRQFPEIAEALSALARQRRKPIVVDGEIVALNRGKPARFQELQGRMHVTDSTAIAGHRDESPAALMVFDLLMEGDRPLLNEPWTDRRERLEMTMKRAPEALRLTEVRHDGQRMLDEAQRRGWEGIMAKQMTATYRPGERTRDWLKLKIEHRQEFVVGGYTEPRNSRQYIGAILLGVYDKTGNFIYTGHTGGGFSGATLTDMYKRLEPLETDKSPFTTRPKTNAVAHWVRPKVVVEVKFNEWTADGKLRQPIFLGVRDDKNPKTVVREGDSVAKKTAEKKTAATRSRVKYSAKAPAKRATSSTRRGRGTGGGPYAKVIADLDRIQHEEGGSGTLQLDSGPLQVTSLGKVFFPKSGQTKGDLMRYYASVAPYILPAIEDRPLVLRRFPNGIDGMAFYQQKAPAEAPKAVRVEKVSDEGITTEDRLIGGDLATLLYIIQLGAVSIDPWHSRAPDVQYADHSIIDLDPGPKTTFRRVIDVARWVKEVLDELGLHAVPKTSGASGIHIVLPLGPKVPNDAARMVAELVATTVADRHEKEATVIRQVKNRPETSVYADYLQNIRGKTVAGVYSARAVEGAQVSTPLTWDEVKSGLDPSDFTIDNAPARFAKVGDLWAKGMKKANRLDKLIKAGTGKREAGTRK
jgi:bifunctional non-homologous end joining protein LigD